jgi:hypothetical protein
MHPKKCRQSKQPYYVRHEYTEEKQDAAKQQNEINSIRDTAATYETEHQHKSGYDHRKANDANWPVQKMKMIRRHQQTKSDNTRIFRKDRSIAIQG